MSIAIKVEKLSKIYKLYNQPTDRLKESLSIRGKKYHRDFYALKDVSFEIKKGETVGIVGKNGSGKSTLLKIISGILTPSDGNLQINGTLAALLELGAGFNPEYTGIENIYLNGAIMGFNKEKIKSKLDDILGFADIGEFVYQPVKTYSSGMLVRLAFAIAINVEPEILIVDEALAVGDEAFQRKCFSRISLIKEKGVTVLFVSHSASTIIELCERALLLDEGELLLSGSPKFIITKYHQLLYINDENQRQNLRNHIKNLSLNYADSLPRKSGYGNSENCRTSLKGNEYYDPNLIPKSTIYYSTNNDYGVRIIEPKITTLDGEQVNNLISNNQYIYKYRVLFEKTAFGVRFGMLIKTITGFELGGAASSSLAEAIDIVEKNCIMEVMFRFTCSLHANTYFVNAGVLGIINGEETYLDRIIDAVMFRVVPQENTFETAVVSFLIKPSYYCINS
ncbi:MAG: ABC transporter ATP-binding protein [Firmicutes bacterium]|nr:ABC transporter ATP-binding protein [Bacillota bacterium]